MSRIFITGASSGIGKALAIELGCQGHTLGLAARRPDRLEEVATLIKEAGGQVQIYPLDVRDRQAQMAALKNFAESGGLDGVVANAGFGLTKPILETTPEEAKELFDVNFFGLLNTLQASAPYLTEGIFVGVSSTVTYGLPTGYGVYSATKSAVSALLTTMRRETQGKFQVVLVNPGETETDFWQVVRQRSDNLIPVKSPFPLAQPKQVAVTISKILTKPKPEVFITKFEHILPILRGVFPGILEWYLRVVERA
ncbi:MAG: SDR family oxidoreductase [Xenococcaceae cyanobacterium MO_188.B19]|nr:SDR family oxidoreductase [Xenococcaceae cyanobacterium MO_188.B19]